MTRRTLALCLRYRGDVAHGWQRQTNAESVQGLVEQAIAACMDGAAVTVHGSSRTDAGAHARMQMAAADVRADLSPRRWLMAINAALPAGAAVQWAAWAPRGFRPRGFCGEKTYVYRFAFRRARDPLSADRAWWIPERLHLDGLADLAASWQGRHDFRAACSLARSEAESTVRTLTLSSFAPGDGISTFTVRSRGFLTHQVRILAGTLVAVARGTLTADAVAAAFAAGDRDGLGATAPAHGLTLEHIDVPDPGWSDAWPTPYPTAV